MNVLLKLYNHDLEKESKAIYLQGGNTLRIESAAGILSVDELLTEIDNADEFKVLDCSYLKEDIKKLKQILRWFNVDADISTKDVENQLKQINESKDIKTLIVDMNDQATEVYLAIKLGYLIEERY